MNRGPHFEAVSNFLTLGPVRTGPSANPAFNINFSPNYLGDERLADARLDGEQQVEPGPVDAVVLDGRNLQQEAGHVQDLALLLLALVRDADGDLCKGINQKHRNDD